MNICVRLRVIDSIMFNQTQVNFITRTFANHQFSNFEEYSQLFREVETWNAATVRDAMAFPNWKSSPYHPVPAGYSLFHAFEMMAR